MIHLSVSNKAQKSHTEQMEYWHFKHICNGKNSELAQNQGSNNS